MAKWSYKIYPNRHASQEIQRIYSSRKYINHSLIQNPFMHSSIQVFASTFYQALHWASGTELKQPVSALRALGQVTRTAKQTQKLHYNLERVSTEDRTTCCGSVSSAWECGGTPSCLPSIYPSLTHTNRILIFVGDDNVLSWKCTHPSFHCRERWPQDSSDQWDVRKHCWERLLGKAL